MEVTHEQHDSVLELVGKKCPALVRIHTTVQADSKFRFGTMSVAGVFTVKEILGPNSGQIIPMVISGGTVKIFVFRGQTAWEDGVTYNHVDFFVLDPLV